MSRTERVSSFTRPCDYFIDPVADEALGKKLRESIVALSESPVVCTPLLLVEARPRPGVTAPELPRPPVILARFLEASEQGDARAEATLSSLRSVEGVSDDDTADHITQIAMNAHGKYSARFTSAIGALRRRSHRVAARLDDWCREQFVARNKAGIIASSVCARDVFRCLWEATSDPELVLAAARSAATTPGATTVPLERVIATEGISRSVRCRAEAAVLLFDRVSGQDAPQRIV